MPPFRVRHFLRTLGSPMIASRRFKLSVALLAVSGLGGGGGAIARDPGVSAPAASKPLRGEIPLSGIWITYSPTGVVSRNMPNGDGTVTASVGDSRPPIFSVRMGSTAMGGTVGADLQTPAGFDRREVRAEDVYRDEESSDPYSEALHRQVRLEHALMHHRPVMGLRVDEKGNSQVESSPELRRHEACARRLLRASIEAQLAAAGNEQQRRSRREELQQFDGNPGRAVSLRFDSAALLLRLANLPLPQFVSAYQLGLEHREKDPGAHWGQPEWRSEQIATHGRAVRAESDLLAAPNSPVASLCRSLAFESISAPRSDTCIIEGVIDRRDGWPIRLIVSRRGEAANGATEAQFRSFDRVAPLEGFVPPPNPCPPAGR